MIEHINKNRLRVGGFLIGVDKSMIVLKKSTQEA